MAGLFTRTDDVDVHAATGDWRSSSLSLLGPVGCFVAGLALSRTDMLGLAPAMLLALIVSLLWLGRRRRLMPGMFWLGMVLGAGNLLYDASLVSVDDAWLLPDRRITATLQEVRHMPYSLRLRLQDVRDAAGHEIRGLVDVFYYGKPLPLLPGQRLTLRVNLHRPHNARNPGAFDYRAWCFDHHIALTGSVHGPVQLVDARANHLARWREHIRQAIMTLPGDSAAVLAALLLADRSMINSDINAAYSATGTAHLLAISGLHMGLVAGLFFWLCRWLLTRREAWIVRCPVRLISLVAGLLAAGCYAALAGWPLPALRAAMMLAAAVLA